MKLSIFKSKIHRATVTEANMDYDGSITIDRGLLDARVDALNNVYDVDGPYGYRFGPN